MASLISEYGEKINRDHPLPEHPNPLFQRDSFVSLNGPWDFAITKNAKRPSAFTQTILVPFAVETALSGVEAKVKKSKRPGAGSNFWAVEGEGLSKLLSFFLKRKKNPFPPAHPG